MPGFTNNTIKKVLRKKINAVAETLPQSLQYEFKSNVIVTGGALVSLLQGEKPNDYDFYFKTKDFVRKIAQHYIDEYVKKDSSHSIFLDESKATNINNEEEERIRIYIKSSGVVGEEVEDESFSDDFVTIVDIDKDKQKFSDYAPIMLTDNAITLSKKVQLIIRFWGTPEEIHKNYDFAHCTCVYDYHTDTLSTPEEALRCILSKQLVYNGSLYPIASEFRLRKFIGRGWRINVGNHLKIILQCNKIDFSNIEMVKEQLIGVDIVYMRNFINLIQNAPNKLDTAYMMETLDKVFGDQ